MRKRKDILAVLLSAAMTVGTVSPVFAGELTDDTLSYYEESENVLIQGMESIPEENMQEVLEEQDIVPEEETDVLPETGAEAIADVLEDGTDALTPEAPETENPEGENSTKPEETYHEDVLPEKDDKGNVTGVSIKKYKGDKLLTTLYWNAADGTWFYFEGDTKKYLPKAGPWQLLGQTEWNIVISDETSGATKSSGGYVLNIGEQSGSWKYYLDEKDITGTEVQELPVYTKDVPTNFFTGAEAADQNKHSGLFQENEKNLYYLEKDGTVVMNDTRIVENVKYYFGADGKCEKQESVQDAGWVKKEDGYYWQKADGTFLEESGWKELDGKRYFLAEKGRRTEGWLIQKEGKYYLDPETGVLVTGLKEVDGKKYYFEPSGEIPGKMAEGWKEIEKQTYYFVPETGQMKLGWSTIDGKKYYFEKDGHQTTGWRSLGGKKYYFVPETGQMKLGWSTIDGKRYYFEKDGHQTTGWRSLGGKKYYFVPKTGQMKLGWSTIDGKKYYFEKDGHQTTGWRSLGGKKYYFVPKTGQMKLGWSTIDGKKYYFEKDGNQTTGWRSIGGKMYYFTEKTGVLRKGWLTLGNTKYYLNKDGSRFSGIRSIGGKKYYFQKNGELLTNEKCYEINGKFYNIDKDGVMKEVPKVKALATKVLDKEGWNLESAFEWTSELKYEDRTIELADGVKEADYLAIYGFEKEKGNSFVMASTFYQMAKILGYDVHYVKGKIQYKSGRLVSHGWCEIDEDGKTYVCDPYFAHEGGKNGIMFEYGDKGTWIYKNHYRVN